ncbi:conserved hypothetical protein [Pediculus humanus corporis]|uniref:INO80 complex subunit F domain-containing protein n=1 Tax=Pediculus humanus subsp. corporis TaxID=121224 RepID=E0VFK6_PEDHC|nr:uncharacterized protein Phum_PHUM160470 [Pediculus humanus corporis]EEB12162.1 conserved hypothetical protein [Pediculus humanus corporis]
MNINDQDMMSEESEDEGGGESREEMIYRRKYQMLLERCEVLQQDNERLVHRIQEVYKYTRQVRKERKFLIDRLDGHGDNWRQGITQYFHDNNNHYGKSSSKLKIENRKNRVLHVRSHSRKKQIWICLKNN